MKIIIDKYKFLFLKLQVYGSKDINSHVYSGQNFCLLYVKHYLDLIHIN